MKSLKSLVLFVFMITVCGLFAGCGSGASGTASAEEYKNDAMFIDSVKNFSQNPEQYKGKKVQLVLNIYDVKINGNDASVYASVDGLDRQGQVFLLHYKMKQDENLNAGELIRVWCEYKGMTESKELNTLGQPEKVMECDAAYIEKPIWGDLYDASENPKRSLSGKADGRDVKFKFSKLKVCVNSLDVEAGVVGITPKDSHSIGQMGTVKFRGTINDAGEGEFQYLDKEGNPSGQKFTLKFSDRKNALIQTDKVAAAVAGDPFMSFIEPKDMNADLDAGSYNVVCDF